MAEDHPVTERLPAYPPQPGANCLRSPSEIEANPPSGRNALRYRFSGSGRFAFRARVRFERAYPYVLGYSARTFVSVG